LREEPAEIARPVISLAIAALMLICIAAPAANAQQAAPKDAAAPQQVAPKPAAAPQQAAPKSDGGKCVGVVSAIGDTFTLKTMGITVFNNAQSKVPIDSWRIDDLVAAKVNAVLGKRLNLQRVNYPKGTFAALEEQHGLFYNPEDDLKGILRRITAGTKCDRYIVVLKTSTTLGSSNQSLRGLGILHDASIVTSYYLYTMFTVRLYDGQSLSVVAQQAASIGQRTFLAAFRGPNREVDETWWPKSDAAQSTKLRDGIRALVEQSLEITLPALLQAN
jgi:hypothetical protein